MIKGLKGPIALGTIRTSLVLGLRLAIQAGTLLLVPLRWTQSVGQPDGVSKL